MLRVNMYRYVSVFPDRNPDTEDVISSNLITPTTNNPRICGNADAGFCFIAIWPHAQQQRESDCRKTAACTCAWCRHALIPWRVGLQDGGVQRLDATDDLVAFHVARKEYESHLVLRERVDPHAYVDLPSERTALEDRRRHYCSKAAKLDEHVDSSRVSRWTSSNL